MSKVFPGVAEVMASLGFLVSMLMRLDFHVGAPDEGIFRKMSLGAHVGP